ncbi:hypothetical protein C7N43_35425 [Sphingobacteriales bacterium UPWRP_1]|nr:hypothetical protein BVG80_04025 [Sphingobacteriales bacterium TSM_CSM]PSJ72212.1 hypothetical protein C7N43_35425 [Sphingobacteriales bacterium UPWRP_1]
MKKNLLIVSVLLISTLLQAQNTGKNAATAIPYDQAVMKAHEDTLIKMFNNIRTQPKEEDRFNACYKFVPELVKALKEPGSFYYPFDSLKGVSIVKPEDDSFRIFTWMVVKGNADNIKTISYKYFGAIQINNPEKLELIPLDDKSLTLIAPEDKVLSSDEWYGALYYGTHTYTYGGTTYYLLFGWDGNTSMSDKKIADLLYFQEGKARFGAPVFEVLSPITNTKSTKHRLVLEFKEGSSITLNFNKEENKIVYDFLAPEDETAAKIAGAAFSYVPDGTYQGMELNPNTGMWEARPLVLKGVSMDAPPRPAPVLDKKKTQTGNFMPPKNKKDKKSKTPKRPRP